MIPGDLLSAFPHRQFHTLPGLLDSWAALPNSNPNACMHMQGGSLHHFYDGLWYDPAERRTHDLPCERRTRYRLSQPDTVVGATMVSCGAFAISLFRFLANITECRKICDHKCRKNENRKGPVRYLKSTASCQVRKLYRDWWICESPFTVLSNKHTCR